MRCPVCQAETPLGLSRCVHCNTALEEPPRTDQSWPPPSWQADQTVTDDPPGAQPPPSWQSGEASSWAADTDGPPSWARDAADTTRYDASADSGTTPYDSSGDSGATRYDAQADAGGTRHDAGSAEPWWQNQTEHPQGETWEGEPLWQPDAEAEAGTQPWLGAAVPQQPDAPAAEQPPAPGYGAEETARFGETSTWQAHDATARLQSADPQYQPTIDAAPPQLDPQPWQSSGAASPGSAGGPGGVGGPGGPGGPGADDVPWQRGTLGFEQVPPEQQAWHYGGGPGGPAAPPQYNDPWQQPIPEKRRRGRVLVVGVWMLVAAGVVAAAAIEFWPKHNGNPGAYTSHSAPATAQPSTSGGSSAPTSPSATPSPSTSGDGQHEATAIDAVLDDLGQTRSDITAALTDAETCGDPSGDLSTLQQAVGHRKQQLSTVKALNVDALTQGTELKQALTNAVQYSLDADSDYLTWLQNNQNCSGAMDETDTNYVDGNNVSITQATPAKKQFTALWTPIAKQYGLTPRPADKI